MKIFKRIVGLLLCLAMVLSFVPVYHTAQAASDELVKIDLQGCVIGTCSSPYKTTRSYKEQYWYSSQKSDWVNLDNFVDGDYSNNITYKVSTTDAYDGGNERGDFYVDLTKKNASGVAVDQLKFYNGGHTSGNMPTMQITLELADGTTKVETFKTNWYQDEGDTLIWNFDKTYNVKGIYVYANSTIVDTYVSFGEFELYQKVGSSEPEPDPETPPAEGTYTKIPLSESNLLGACSENNSGTNYIDKGNLTNVEWEFEFSNDRRVWNNWFNDDYTDSTGWGVSADERGDFLLDLSNGGSGTDVSRVVVSKSSTYNPEYRVPSAYKLILVLMDDTQITEEFSTGWSASGTSDGTTYTHDFKQTYTVKQMYVWATNAAGESDICFGEFELYQKDDGELGETTVSSAGYGEVALTNSNLYGACSQGGAAKNVSTSTNFKNVTWWATASSNFSRIEGLVDGVTKPASDSGDSEWGGGVGEGSDFYLDMGSSGVAIDQIRLYSYKYKNRSEYVTPKEFKVILVLKSGTPVEKTFNTGWAENVADGTSCTFDLGQTYTVTGVYVLSITNTVDYGGANKFSLAEVELYKKTQLPKPANLQATVDGDKITVGANKLSPTTAGKLQFSIDNGASWQDADGYYYTYTKTPGEYTIKARYLATGDGYITTQEANYASISVTVEAAAKEKLATPTITEVTATDTTITINATNNATTPNSKLMYSAVKDGLTPEENDWQESNVITGLDRNTSYDVFVKCVPNDDSYAESDPDVKEIKTEQTILPAPTGLVATEVTDTSITVTADPNPNGVLLYSIDFDNWDREPTFTGLDRNKTYTVYALYAAIDNPDFLNSPYVKITVTTKKTQLGAPDLSVTKTDTTITATADTVEGGTLQFSLYKGGVLVETNDTGVFTGLTHNTQYTVQAVYVPADGYESTEVATEDVITNDCAHTYDDDCDAECNNCGFDREPPHAWENACDDKCDACGATRVPADHVYDNACDATCNVCGDTRVPADHVYDNACDAYCNVCGTRREIEGHTYTDACDTTCNKCEAVRVAPHVWENNCDTECDNCQETREAEHTYDSIYDTECNECGATRTVITGELEPMGTSKIPTPSFGYYDSTTGGVEGPITNFYTAGKGPELMVDGNTTGDPAELQPLIYEEVRDGDKIPVIFFNFGTNVNLGAIEVYGYENGRYNMEDYIVQVAAPNADGGPGEWIQVGSVTDAFHAIKGEDADFGKDTGGLRVDFDTIRAVQYMRILVTGITDMRFDSGEEGDPDYFLKYSSHIRIREITIYHVDAENIEITDASLNGNAINAYQIVYAKDALDYTERAAKYLQEIIKSKTGYQLDVVTDDTAAGQYEIIVGQTSRPLSATIDSPTNQQMKFTLTSDGTNVAMEADYFIIAGAAYYFGETYVPDANHLSKTVPSVKQELEPITKDPNNYIMLIGDGMGVNQTKLFGKYKVTDSDFTGDYDYSDGEDIFYGYYFPYEGRSRTWNILGKTTDSAAGGTALATGYKTTNGIVGRDRYNNDVKSLTELAFYDLKMGAAIFSTEGSDGATPSSFSVHTSGRYETSDIIAGQDKIEADGVKFYDRYISREQTPNAVYKSFTAAEWDVYEPKINEALNALSTNENGFFIMYEEAYIDKNCHNGDAVATFKTLYRFNQAIALFMEYAMYNPDTFVLITADHETGGMTANWEYTNPNPPGETGFDHSMQDVPVFAYGKGAEVFETDVDKGEYYENASIGRTFAHLMTNGHADDFGDPWYPILVKDTTVQEYPEDPTKAPNTGDYKEVIKESAITPYVGVIVNGELTDNCASEAAYLNDGHHGAAGYIVGNASDVNAGTPVARFEFKDGEARKLTGIELVARTKDGKTDAITKFDIQVKVNGEWQTVKQVTSNPFTSSDTVYIAFDKVYEATAVQILVYEWIYIGTNLPMLQEINLYEQKNGVILNQVELEENDCSIEELTDGDKYSHYAQSTVNTSTPLVFNVNLTKDGKPSNIKRLIMHAYEYNCAPSTTIVEVRLTNDADETKNVWTEVFRGLVYDKGQMEIGIADFSEDYDAYEIRVQINYANGGSEVNLTEIEVFGYQNTVYDVSGIVTSLGNQEGTTTIQLMKDGVEAYKTTTTNGQYAFVENIEAGNYTLVATKDGHITAEYDITVGDEPLRQDVVLKYVSSSTFVGGSNSVRLLEPWALRTYATLATGTPENPVPMNITSTLAYGAYAIIEHKTDGTVPTSWEDFVYNENAIKFEKNRTEATDKIYPTSVGGRNYRTTVLFDFYEDLYTFRLAKEIYWIIFYEDAQGIHFTKVYNTSLTDLADTLKADPKVPTNEKNVLTAMQELHQAVVDYRGEDQDYFENTYPAGVPIANSGINTNVIDSPYKFGKKHQIRLVEPWGFKVTMRFGLSSSNVIDPSTVDDYGMVFYHDKIDEYKGAMTAQQVLKKTEEGRLAYVFSKSNGNATLDGDAFVAIYDKELFTYQLNSDLYCLPFVVVEGQTYYRANAICWNLRDQMEAFSNDANRKDAERRVFTAMVDLYEAVAIYRKGSKSF